MGKGKGHRRTAIPGSGSQALCVEWVRRFESESVRTRQDGGFGFPTVGTSVKHSRQWPLSLGRDMHAIKSELEFADILPVDAAIVFVNFQWSGQSRLSAAVVSEWERTSNLWGLNCPPYSVSDLMKSRQSPLG